MDATCIDYKSTGFFSRTVIDYLEDVPELRSFYSYRPDLKGFHQLLEQEQVTADRQLLATVLTEQYERTGGTNEVPYWPMVKANIELLRNHNAFTITTGHQLNVFTGPLYFLYKIVSAIKLCGQLKDAFPDKDFVPVYWMASEDHDFAEINYTNIGHKKIQWNEQVSGATGRLNIRTFRECLNQYKGILGLEGHATELAQIVETAYGQHDNLADAMRYLVNALFGRYGLVIIDADDARLKKHFSRIITEDVTGQHSFKHITESNALLQKLGVHTQVNPREINFFYLTDELRERIVQEGDDFIVLNTDIRFTRAQLEQEIADHPERFSPNVVMRPLYQEYILPNLAYIGGGAELVYWLQLKANFDHYNVTFPILILRNSALLIRQESAAKAQKMGLSTAQLFENVDTLKNQWVHKHSQHDLTLKEEWRELQCVFEKLKLRAHKIDPTLGPSAEAVQARLKHAIDNLETKLTKAEKRNHATHLRQLEAVKAEIFPNNSLQERSENFGLFYVKWGQVFIDELIRNLHPLDFKFTVLWE
ncbi:bacillithiol biosynthesis cysteine-adding enzyme BshC [Mucilaginibacter daejeonensis]|uniref:bacillithiol biosynthesis cysteine-adding enzyme BshC n=1 Tax=Mucilaginibacter daejeonensis TaxID=398049 RepID=UPI001D174904|nr:bacillithiol biosynthesis cysteine-adding enzyme BshC [Mucilaginibacter daejeonensis]UEG53340.1 bacillithiol biosynthesis cysteine-adding enzyme BshC [Mucilaginibacter daejeonensis]